MTKYKAYFLHDPIGNTESQILNFNTDEIQKAMDQGFIIIGVTQDGLREIIKSADEVLEPQIAVMEGFTVVLPSYVDSRVDNLAKIVEELMDGIKPEVIEGSVLKNLKKSIQQIHADTLKTIDSDKKMLESSSSITRQNEI